MMTPKELASLRKSFPIQDQSGLNDFQKLPDNTGIAIHEVGINRFRVPLNYRHADGSVMNHDTEARMTVRLRAGKTGINMSRLCLILLDEGRKDTVRAQMIQRLLGRFQLEMRDEPDEEPFEEANIRLDFSYPIRQPSLKSDHVGWQYYRSFIEGRKAGDEVKIYFGTEYEYSSTCPCSLSLAHQYEDEYRRGLTDEGNGIAAAHAQRSVARVTVEVDPEENFYLEELVQILRSAIPTETQVLVKRVDEQAFAILNGSHPMFVEHVARRLYQTLNNDERILDWSAMIEHQESLHSHNAIAHIRKGLPGGL
jgi:GTP cyclohydrolase I